MNWDMVSTFLFNFLTYGIFLYSTTLLLSYVLIALYSVGETRRYMWKNSFTDYRVLASSVHAPSVSILAPAYNEGKTVVENVRSLLSIFYANMEVIIINDGSKDDSLARLIDAYDLEKTDFFVHEQIPTKAIRGIYKSRNSIYNKLIVVDKENGGKADALNVGINVSSNNYLVCIDVDCILEQDALLKMVKPFLEQTDKRVIATGGVVRIANSCVIEDGRLIKVKLAEDYLPRIQILEYIRAFILGRMAWSRLNGLMLISGAFGAFDKEIAIKCGGYNHNTVGEDMELVVRMRRYMEERKQKYVVTYIPDPLCWTEAPASFKILGRQRNRWIRGTYETLMLHKRMFFNPSYGLLGLLSYPYWFFFELLAPIIEFAGLGFFIFFAWFGYIDWDFFFSFLIFIVCFGYLYSSFAILMEVLTFNQYKRRIDVLRLLLTGMTEPFYYHPFVVWSAIKGYFDLIKKKKGWGEMTRQGFAQPKTAVLPQPAPVLAQLTDATLSAPTPDPVKQSVPHEAPKESVWFVQRTLIPAIVRVASFVTQSFRYYINHALVLLLLLLVARGYELVYELMKHGTPDLFGKVLLIGLAKDLVFFLQLGALFYPVFALCYLLHKKLAQTVFIFISVILLLVQLALSEYFITTLVPLGADLWGYSIADIRQTVGASGGVKPAMILLLLAMLSLFSTSFIYLPKKIKVRGWPLFGFFLAFLLVLTTEASKMITKWLPGKEHSNNISLNKSQFFLTASLEHFFPQKMGEDIYSDQYSGDYSNSSADAKQFAFNYVDEKNYPFLHLVDSSKDVLSPYFNQAETPPNIVILLVEGLGRAFTNKGAALGNFTPFIDSLSGHSLYWENLLSEGGRTFAALPSVLSSMTFAKNGFSELGEEMPPHLSLLNLLKHNGYSTSFYYGGDSHFDNMDVYLKKNAIDEINDEKTFPAGYTKMPSYNGFSWGYGDKELFRRFLNTQTSVKQPYLSVVLTVSTHSPFGINEQDRYLSKLETRMNELGLSEKQKAECRRYNKQYASILYADDAIRDFMDQYRRRPDFANTVFLITGDHRMPEIPMSTKLDRYHVPLLLYSPRLARTAKFSSVSTHFDITPSLVAWLKKSYDIKAPDTVAWMGSGLDTARQFRNIHAYPIMQTKTDLIDFVKENYLLNGKDLYTISNTMDLEINNDEAKKNMLRAAFNQFKAKNERFLQTRKVVPDSLLEKYAPR